MPQIKWIWGISLLICIFCVKASAQKNGNELQLIWADTTQPDSSRFQSINKYYPVFTHAYPDSALALTQYHYALAVKKDAQQEMSKALNEKAYAYYILGHPDSAMQVLQKALDINFSLNDSIGIARLQTNIGSICRDQNKYQEAVRYYSQGLSIFKEKNAPLIMQADAINNLGLIYEDVKLYKLALEYLNEALVVYDQAGVQDKNGNIWLNIGVVHHDLGNIELAQEYIQKALGILQSQNNRFSIADCYFSLMMIYEDLGEIDTARSYLEKSLALNRELGNTNKILRDQTLVANMIRPSNLQEALGIGEEVLPSALKTSNKYVKADVYRLLYQCYKEQGRYNHALEMHEKYLHYHDSIQIDENKIEVIREAIQQEYEEKLFEGQLANEKKQAQLELAQLKKIYAIIFVSLLFIFALFLYTRHRNTVHRLQKEALLAEIEKLKEKDMAAVPMHTRGFQLDRDKVEQSIGKKLNETDWTVLNILLQDPVVSNKSIAEQAFKSVDGIGSSLRRMYVAFEIKESRYKKISLLMEAMKRSHEAQ